MMKNPWDGQLDNGQLTQWMVRRLGDRQHNSDTMEINSVTAMQGWLMEQEMDNLQDGRLGNG